MLDERSGNEWTNGRIKEVERGRKGTREGNVLQNFLKPTSNLLKCNCIGKLLLRRVFRHECQEYNIKRVQFRKKLHYITLYIEMVFIALVAVVVETDRVKLQLHS